MSARGTSRHERAFRVLLRLYPAWFREAHEEDMTILFRSRLERARNRRGLVGVWARVVSDTLSTAVALRRGNGSTVQSEGRGSRMEMLLQDIRYAARHLVRAPLFTTGAVALLAVGIGANTAVFTVVDAFLFRPPPWERPEEVVRIYQDSDDGEPSSSSFPAFRDMATYDAFTVAAAMTESSAAWDGPAGPRDVRTEYATSGYLDVLGLAPQMGRWFSPEHDVPGGAPAAVVSAPAWRTHFGGDPSVVGRSVRLNGFPVTIIGVGPEGLTGSEPPMVTDFWLSISATVVSGSFQVANLERRQDHWYQVRARLAPGVSLEQAQAAMDALAARLADDYPELNHGRDITVFRATDVRFHPSSDGELVAAASILGGVVVTVLLLACANLANLLLVRGLGRSGEMAVRRALGAGRNRVARLFLVESLLLSAMGGALGLILARWSLAALPGLPLPFPFSESLELAIDWRVGIFALSLMVATGLFFGLAPALRSAKEDLAGTLRDDRRGVSMGRGTMRLRNLLVAVQVAASLVLVLGTGLLGRSLTALQGMDTGVDPERVAYVRTSFGQAGMSAAEAAVALDELVERVSALPGVSSAAATSRLPAQPSGTTTTVVEGYTPPTGTDAVELSFAVVSPEYFETVGLPLLEGRSFTEDDAAGTQTVVLVNETAAMRFWGGADVVGRRMRSQGNPDSWRVVVGVVGDAPVNSLSEPVRPMFYFARAQAGLLSAYLLARTDGDPSTLLAPMRGELQTVRASLPVSEQGTLEAHFGAALAGPRLAAGAMTAFSLLAVVLAGLGIYAVVSFSVAGRAGELGIRMALGAEREGVVRLMVGEVVGTVMVGLALGLAAAAFVASRIQGLLFGVQPMDPVAFGGALLFLLMVAGVAAWLPARRAARADPVDALRSA